MIENELEEKEGLIKRARRNWNAKTPKRHKRIVNLCTGLVAVAGVIVAIPASIIVVPTAVLTYASLAIFVGGFFGIKSKLKVEK
jgi:predicted membrane channel-forming protein YqfA (hemolysin III family)